MPSRKLLDCARTVVVAALALLGGAALSEAQERVAKLDAALQDALHSGAGNPRVIVRTRREAFASIRQSLQSHGDLVYGETPALSALFAKVHNGDLALLAADPNVESISIDAVVSADAAAKSSSSDSVGFLRQILGLGSFHAGASVVVAVVDSGIQPNDDFAGRIVAQYDFVNGKRGAAVSAYDDYGHGTHVAGLIGSSGALSSGKYAGVASAVRFVSLKVLDKWGRGRTSDVIAALDWIVANKDRVGIKVVNLSLGHPVYEPASSDPLVLAVERAVRAGVVVVASAGNFGTNPNTGRTGYGGITSPGNAPSAITVGAADHRGTATLTDDAVARYSSRGPTWYDGMAKPDIVAPGHGLVSDSATLSTLETSLLNLVVTDSTKKFMKLSGSSMATAVVSGVAALAIDVNRMGAEQRARKLLGGKYVNSGAWVRPADLSPNAIKAVLQYTAYRLRDGSGVPLDPLTQGTGQVNAIGALYAAYCLDTTVAAGAVWLPAVLPRYTTIGSDTLVWSQDIVWGTSIFSGADLLDVRQSAWDENIVWGTGDENIVWGTFDGEDIVWGTSIFDGLTAAWTGDVTAGENIVWGTNSRWDENIVWGTGLLGFYDGENIVWGTAGDENIVWGTLHDENIVWGTNFLVRALSSSLGGL